MENSRNPDAERSPPQERSPRDRFDPDALAHVLTESLRLTPKDPLFIAYSGGMDSHVLLHAAAALRTRTRWPVSALHIDHGLQPASEAWARHAAAVCAALAVPYRAERVAVRDIAELGLEEAARRARYDALRRLLPAGAVLVTAHHQDDQAETLLLQLLRGAGPAGLAGMPAIAPFGRGRIARPLLDFPRAALARYAAEHGLTWVEDASNRDVGLARNFLRQRVFPVLAERWPRAAARLAAAARHQAEALVLLEALGREDVAACADEEGALSVAALLALAPERRRNALRYWLRAHGARAPSERVLREMLARIETTPQTRHAAVRLPEGEVRRYRDRLVWLAHGRVPTAWEAVWEPTQVLEGPGGAWRLRAASVQGRGLSQARVAGKTLRVRLRRGGERCLLRGHHRELKKLLQEAGVPPWERAHLPLVYVDDTLAAIGDRWVCDPYAARNDEPGFALVLERPPREPRTR